MRRWVSKLWCSLTHGGGSIERDALGRINWQCCKCGRWSDDPVSPEEERRIIDSDIIKYHNEGST